MPILYLFLHAGHAGGSIDDSLALVLLVVVVIGVLLALSPRRGRRDGSDKDEPV
jgi:hypothetical protein